ncbi:hypothetical protein [Undibacterium umbellatum]|uniref:Uncharacterized protein n=1 Tax=Undibacterium umbellatum TaxID=2762300 RepID=A0ABR6Z3Y7_9BURK|nr:hypothetical protein [Undibacterium umbellatum]MBC3906462.1 hypothetical protein [Undibacterium umbellatum]
MSGLKIKKNIKTNAENTRPPHDRLAHCRIIPFSRSLFLRTYSSSTTFIPAIVHARKFMLMMQINPEA